MELAVGCGCEERVQRKLPALFRVGRCGGQVASTARLLLARGSVRGVVEVEEIELELLARPGHAGWSYRIIPARTATP